MDAKSINIKSVGTRLEMEFPDGNKGTAYLCIADIAHKLLTPANEREVAAEISRRFNSHYSLIEALEIATEYVEQFKNRGAIGEIDKDLIKIKSALEKATNHS